MTPHGQTELALPVSEHTPPEIFDSRDRSNTLEFLLTLAKHKRIVLWFVTCAIILSSGLVLLLHNNYRGQAKIMPPQQGQSFSASMLDQLGGLGSLLGAAGGSSLLRNPGDLYVAMLKSRTIADHLISRFSLMAVYKAKRLTDARNALEGNTMITLGKEGVISIAVEDHDQTRAAEIANAYVDELEKLTKVLAITDASKRRIFFEREAKVAQGQLEAAEQDLKKTELETGIFQPDSQSKVMFQAYADVRALATEKELEIESMRTFATPDNPDLIRLQHELSALRSQIGAMEKGQKGVAPVGEIALEKVPEKQLKYIDKLREVTYHTALLQLMLKQYEVARVDEAKDFALIQVLDPAVPPEKKSGPFRSLIVLACAFLALLLAVAWIYLREAVQRIKESPNDLARWQLLRFYLSRKRTV